VKKDVEFMFVTQADKLKKYFKAYFFMTCFAQIFDFMALLVVLHNIGQEIHREYMNLFLLVVTLIFILTNLLWAGYALLMLIKFPYYIAKYLEDLLFGAGSYVNQKIVKWSRKLRGSNDNE